MKVPHLHSPLAATGLMTPSIWYLYSLDATYRIWRREDWMIYRGPGFLAAVWFGSSPTPYLPPSTVSKLDRRHTGRLRKRDNLLGGGGGGKKGFGRGAESYESLVLYKSFNNLCFPCGPVHGEGGGANFNASKFGLLSLIKLVLWLYCMYLDITPEKLKIYRKKASEMLHWLHTYCILSMLATTLRKFRKKVKYFGRFI